MGWSDDVIRNLFMSSNIMKSPLQCLYPFNFCTILFSLLWFIFPAKMGLLAVLAPVLETNIWVWGLNSRQDSRIFSLVGTSWDFWGLSLGLRKLSSKISAVSLYLCDWKVCQGPHRVFIIPDHNKKSNLTNSPPWEFLSVRLRRGRTVGKFWSRGLRRIGEVL